MQHAVHASLLGLVISTVVLLKSYTTGAEVTCGGVVTANGARSSKPSAVKSGD